MQCNLRILVLILFLFILWDTYGIIMIPAEVWYCKHQGKFDRQTTDELITNVDEIELNQI